MVIQTVSLAKVRLPKISLKKIDWTYFTVWVGSIAAAVFVLTWQLSGLTYHRLSATEQATLTASNSWHNLLADPLYLPYKLVEWLILHLGGSGHIFAIRLAPVIFALIALWLFVSIVRHWFNKPTYVLATILFGSSLWFLHFGRLAVPTILLALVPLVVIRVVLWFRHLKKEQATKGYRLIAILPLIISLTLYVPGAWLLWLAVAVWQYHKLILLIKRLPWKKSLSAAVLAVALLAPLAYGLATHPSLVVSWLGINAIHATSFWALASFWDWPLYLLGHGPDWPTALWLGAQPLLDAFSAAMAIAGFVFYCRNFRLRQAKLLALTLVAALIAFVMSNGILLGYAVGLAYLLAAAGIGYLLQIWRKVFPRNPVAYGGAVGLLIIATAAAVLYTTRSYYVAWHYQPATHKAFSIKI